MKLLFIGDVVGKPGRELVAALAPRLREEHEVDFVVANGENAAGGVGISARTARALLGSGIDALTLGNHTYRHRDVYEMLDSDKRIVRPVNFPKGSPGHGTTVIDGEAGRLAIVNVEGMLFLEAARSPFHAVDAALAELEGRADWTLVDLHAEATSEKVAMGWHLDGRVTACVGTHTHVPTADGRVLPGGSAYITDVGMTGPRDGVIGVQRELAIQRFLTMVPVKFETAKGATWMNAVLIEAGDDGRATSIEQLILPGDERT